MKTRTINDSQKSSKNLPKSFRSFFFAILWEHKWRCVLTLFTCFTAWPLSFFLVPYSVGLFTDIATAVGESGKLPTWSMLMWPIILFCGARIYEGVFWRLLGWNEAHNSPAMTIASQRKVLDYALGHSYRYYMDHFSGSIANKLNDVSGGLVGIWRSTTAYYLPSIICCIVGIVSFFVFVNVQLAIICTIWIVGFALITYIFSRRNSILSRHYAEKRSGLSGQIVDTLSNHQNFRLFSRQLFEKRRLWKHQENMRSAYQSNLNHINYERIAKDLWDILMVVGGMFLYSVYLFKIGEIDAKAFIIVFYLAMQLAEYMMDIGNSFPDLIKDWSACQQALTVIQKEHEIKDMPGAKPLVMRQGNIVFDKVSFGYHEGTSLFSGFDLQIEAGSKVGLVGFSGAGKTSFVNLLLRHFDYQSGHILIDDQEISKVQQQSLRDQISMIPQDVSLFHRSLIDNVRYGRLDATDKEVIEACKKARADEFIEKLEEGYDTIVGDRGLKLSGGQRQRVAIARAFLKDSKILILDESTSALDSVTEKYIQNSLYDVMKNRTTIVVAHRLSTLLEMDRIIVFDNGQIIEDGTHEELLEKQDGHYCAMWHMQAGGFLPNKKKKDNELA